MVAAKSNEPYTIVRNTSIRIDDEQVRLLVKEYVLGLRLPGAPSSVDDIEVHQATSDGGLTAVARYREE